MFNLLMYLSILVTFIALIINKHYGYANMLLLAAIILVIDLIICVVEYIKHVVKCRAANYYLEDKPSLISKICRKITGTKLFYLTKEEIEKERKNRHEDIKIVAKFFNTTEKEIIEKMRNRVIEKEKEDLMFSHDKGPDEWDKKLKDLENLQIKEDNKTKLNDGDIDCDRMTFNKE